jgi:putative transposase
VSVIDIFTKLAHVALVNHLSSKSALTVFRSFQTITPFVVHTVQTDNGSEFLGDFHKDLEKQAITHLFIYPHSPRINGVVERFNRTIQQEFLTRCETLQVDRLAFEDKLEKYLDWYNNTRPHTTLHYLAPLQFINQIPISP